MNDSLDDLLQRYFDDVERDDRLGDTPARVVMRRGRRRRARRRTGAMAGTLAVGALGSVFAVRTLSRGDAGERRISIGQDGTSQDGTSQDGTSEDGVTPSPVPTSGDLAFGPSPLVWNEVTVGSAESVAVGPVQTLQDTDGTLYAVSSQPGRSDSPRPTLYRSDDGIRWATVRELPGDTAARLNGSASADDGRLYVVGTQAAAAPTGLPKDPGDPVLFATDDVGATWSSQPVPVDLQAIRTIPGVAGVMMNGQAAVKDGTTVVAAVTVGSLDYQALLPEGVDPAAVDWWNDPNGAVVYELRPMDCNAPPSGTGAAVPETTVVMVASGPDGGCMQRGPEVARYSWADLGLSAEAVAASQGTLHLATSVDGSTFVPHEVAAPGDGWRTSRVQASSADNQFVVLVTYGRPAGDAGYEEQTIAYTSPDGTEWTSSEPLLLPAAVFGTLADGTLAATGGIYPGGAQPPTVALLRDGHWDTVALPPLPADAGIVVGGEARVGARGIAMLVTTAQPTDAPTGIEMAPGGLRFDPASTTRYLLFSTDGRSWSSERVPGSDQTTAVANVQVTDTNVILTIVPEPPSANADGPLPDQRVLVGTLAG